MSSKHPIKMSLFLSRPNLSLLLMNAIACEYCWIILMTVAHHAHGCYWGTEAMYFLDSRLGTGLQAGHSLDCRCTQLCHCFADWLFFTSSRSDYSSWKNHLLILKINGENVASSIPGVYGSCFSDDDRLHLLDALSSFRCGCKIISVSSNNGHLKDKFVR